jgi:putative phosphoribosyl transferase
MGKLFEDKSLRDKAYVFRDRSEAGDLLADRLSDILFPEGIILAIPAGGIPVALEIARKIHLPLDLMIVRKVQIPGNPEAGFGAMGPDGEVIFNEPLLRRLRLTEDDIEKQVARTRQVVEERNRVFRGGRPFPDVRERTTILVDDGLASGYTMTEAVRFLQKGKVAKTIVAVPTASEESVNRLLPLVDEIYCLNVRTLYPFAVAEAYENWYDLDDREVIARMKSLETPK